MEKKVSVVIPTYRRPQLLKNCIAAMAQQDFDRDAFEIVVVSDGPDFQTRTMLNEIYAPVPFVQYITLPENRGPAAARNAGWQAATGKLILFTDDDCLPSPSWVSSFWNEYFRCNEPTHIAFTGRVIVPLPEEPTDFERNTSHLESADFVTANCACSRQALRDIGGFDERFRLAWREDSDLEFRLLGNNIRIDRKVNAVVVHPVRKADSGVSIREQRKTMFNALLYKKFPSLYRKKIQASPAWNYYCIVGGFALAVGGIVMQSRPVAIAGLGVYLGFTAAFVARRLTNTSRSSEHVMEMIATSMVIPFASLYWTLYGSLKYKVLYY